MEHLRAELELLRAESRENFRHVHERLDKNDERMDALLELLAQSRTEMRGVRDHLDRLGNIFDRAFQAMLDGFALGQRQLDDHEARIRALERRLAS